MNLNQWMLILYSGLRSKSEEQKEKYGLTRPEANPASSGPLLDHPRLPGSFGPVQPSQLERGHYKPALTHSTKEPGHLYFKL